MRLTKIPDSRELLLSFTKYWIDVVDTTEAYAFLKATEKRTCAIQEEDFKKYGTMYL